MCTSINIVAKDHSHLLARTMDWDALYIDPVFAPRGYRWSSEFDHHEYQNQYAILGGGFTGRGRIDLADGVNEFGLMAQKLTFKNGAQLVEERHPDKVQLAAFELIFYLLGRFRSIEDVANHIDEIELMADTNADSPFGKSEQHFVLTDPTGRTVVIEPTTWPLKIIDNPLGVMTNMPRYYHQLDRLSEYVDFSANFRAGTVPLNTFHVTTGRLSGKKTPPGATTPGARFIRAAYMKELADQPADRAEALATGWHLLDTVTVLKSKAHRPTYSVYRAVTVAEDRSYYYQAYHQAQITALRITPELLARTAPLVYHEADRWQLAWAN